MKYCPACKRKLPIAEFHRNRSRYDGLSPHCKNCRNKLSSNHYHKGAGKLIHQINYASHRDERVKSMREYAKSHRRESSPYDSQKAPARRAVYRAVSNGDLVRSEFCEECGAKEKTQAHHHNGYDIEHYLDVVWLCRHCHDKADHPEFAILMEAID